MNICLQIRSPSKQEVSLLKQQTNATIQHFVHLIKGALSPRLKVQEQLPSSIQQKRAQNTNWFLNNKALFKTKIAGLPRPAFRRRGRIEFIRTASAEFTDRFLFIQNKKDFSNLDPFPAV